MSASQRACRKLVEWLNFCKSIGWDASVMPQLTDLWWQYHDEQTGELRAPDAASGLPK
jgi:hypothetical protein